MGTWFPGVGRGVHDTGRSISRAASRLLQLQGWIAPNGTVKASKGRASGAYLGVRRRERGSGGRGDGVDGSCIEGVKAMNNPLHPTGDSSQRHSILSLLATIIALQVILGFLFRAMLG